MGIAKAKVSRPAEPAVEEPSPPFGEFLAARMDALGINGTDLARLSGVDSSTISNLKGSTYEPGLKVLRKLAKPLGLTLGEVLVAAGVGKPEDFTITTAAPLRPSLQRAQDRFDDPNLSDKRKAKLDQYLDEVIDRFDDVIQFLDQEARERAAPSPLINPIVSPGSYRN